MRNMYVMWNHLMVESTEIEITEIELQVIEAEVIPTARLNIVHTVGLTTHLTKKHQDKIVTNRQMKMIMIVGKSIHRLIKRHTKKRNQKNISNREVIRRIIVNDAIYQMKMKSIIRKRRRKVNGLVPDPGTDPGIEDNFVLI